MRAWRELSPIQLGRRIALGNVLLVLPLLLVLSIPSWRSASHSWHRAGTWVVLLSFVYGFVTVWIPYTALRRGVMAEKWPETDLQTLRKASESKLLNWLAWVPLLIWLVDLFVSRHVFDDLVFFSVVTQPVSILWNVRSSVEPRTETYPKQPMKYARLRSEHWGEGRSNLS